MQGFNFSILKPCIFIYSILFFYSCLIPIKSFDKTKTPPPPDYSKTENWAALPDKKDSADAVIVKAGIIDEQQNAKVDVFFVHPTTFSFSSKWNAPLTLKRVNKRTDKLSMRYQASVFNGSCKVYAPRYRQAVLITYLDKKGNAPKVFDLAYADVREAFLYYLKNYNKGRPFIIASHSQGTDHTVRLIKEFFKDTLLKKQLVVAYLIGRPIVKGSLKEIPLGDSATQYGCFVTWNTLPWGRNNLFSFDGKDIECINPLTWKNDTGYVSASFNKGSLPLQFNKIDIGLADAKVTQNGLLWVHRPNKTNHDYMYVSSKSFHVLDYSFFYMNIRENVKQRMDAYFGKK